jgi:hypothetical protein
VRLPAIRGAWGDFAGLGGRLLRVGLVLVRAVLVRWRLLGMFPLCVGCGEKRGRGEGREMSLRILRGPTFDYTAHHL